MGFPGARCWRPGATNLLLTVAFLSACSSQGDGGSGLTGGAGSGAPASGGSQGNGGSASGGFSGSGDLGSGGTSASGGRIGGGAGGKTATGTGGGVAGAGESGGTSGAAGAAGRGGAGDTGTGGSAGAGGGGHAGATGGVVGTGGTGGTPAAVGPCDIFASGSTPCVAAHSTVRALYGSYRGNLYQVRRASDNTTKDIPLLSPGGFADSAQQDTFCARTTCTISIIYDQSPQGNHLPVSPPVHWLPTGGKATDAAAAKITLSGHPVYGVYVVADAGNSYRNDSTKGVAIGDQPEAMYMVADGKRYNNRCCFDYGNVETSGNDDGNATMEAINWGNITQWSQGSGNGPWIEADLENGVYAGGPTTALTNTPLVANYVTLMLKGPSGDHFTLKDGDAQSGALAGKWDGARPSGYSPMKKEGAIELGTGGDGSAGGIGTFFEGAVTSGNSSDAVDDAVQANIVAAGYGR